MDNINIIMQPPSHDKIVCFYDDSFDNRHSVTTLSSEIVVTESDIKNCQMYLHLVFGSEMGFEIIGFELGRIETGKIWGHLSRKELRGDAGVR